MFALAAVLSSCSKSEVMDSRYENIPISFTTYNGRTPEVKATTIDNEYFPQFYVLADHKVGDTETSYIDAPYNNTVADKGFPEGKQYYWPADGSLNFYAFAPVPSETNSPTVVTVSNKILTITVPEYIENHQDVVVATVAGKTFDNSQVTDDENNTTKGQVALTFNHMLSRVHFAIVGDNDTDDIKINSLTIKNLYTKGTVDMYQSTPSVTASSDTDDLEDYTYKNSIAINADTEDNRIKGGIYSGEEYDNRYMMIIPQNIDATNSIVIDYEFNGDKTFTGQNAKEINLNNYISTLAAGNSYLFTFKIQTNTITFDVTVEPWTENSDDNKELPLN